MILSSGKVKDMGSILNPIEGNSFVDLAVYKNEEIFVDKTEFIEKMSEHINKNKRFLAVTRPRRFGKTVTADMLSAYYSKGYADQNIFEGLKITGKMEDRVKTMRIRKEPKNEPENLNVERYFI